MITKGNQAERLGPCIKSISTINRCQLKEHIFEQDKTSQVTAITFSWPSQSD